MLLGTKIQRKHEISADDFKTDDLLLAPIKEGSIGDAYMELGDTDEALKQYRKAYSLTENELTTPVYKMKAAEILESQQEYGKALALYQEIKKEYPKSNEGTSIDKYIARVKLKMS